MKLVLHLVGKDLKHLRAWIIGWLVTLSLPVVIGGLLLGSEPDTREWNAYGMVAAAALGLQMVVAYLMTILLVQADRVVGTEAFWVTRPISAGRLLTAKVATAALVFVGGAVLLYLPWWLFCGVGGRGILGAIVELIPPTAAVVVPAMLIGALTDSLGRALLWSLILAALGVMVPGFFSVVLSNASGRLGSDLALLVLIGCGATLLAMAAAVLVLYQTRRYTRWLAMPAAGLVVALMVGRYVPLIWRPANEPAEWRPERATQVTVGYHDAYSRPGAPSRNSRERWDNAWVAFALRDAPAGWSVEGVGARHRWAWAGGTHFGREGRVGVLGTAGRVSVPGFTGLPPDPETVEWRRQQSRPRRASSLSVPMTGPEEGIWVQANILLPGSIAERLDRETATYAGSLWLALRRVVVMNETPAEAGSWRRGTQHAMRVESIGTRDDAVLIRLVDTTPFSWVSTYREWRLRGSWFGTRNEGGFLLMNRDRREFLTLNDRPRALVVAGVQLTWHELTAGGLRVRRADRWEDRAGWLDDATLAMARAIPESVFRRDIRVEAMRVRRTEP